VVVNATTITATTPAGSAGTASVLARTLGGAKAANTLFTYVTPAPTVTITAANPTEASAATVGATASVVNATRFTLTASEDKSAFAHRRTAPVRNASVAPNGCSQPSGI
jgi:hypothetical protein